MGGHSFQRICVFCGTNAGSRPEYGAAARELGKLLAQEDIELVYGGASVGIMGELADAVHEHGGHVTGIIPQQLVKKEAAHMGIPVWAASFFTSCWGMMPVTWPPCSCTASASSPMIPTLAPP